MHPVLTAFAEDAVAVAAFVLVILVNRRLFRYLCGYSGISVILVNGCTGNNQY